MTVRSRIIGCGSYLPSNVVTNDELAKRVDTSDEWIVARTGIRQRHVAAEGETTSDLAVAAATRAMEHAGVTAADIDMIIVATATPDNTFPATATKVQHRLGVVGFAFDVQAVCSGFVYALTTADMYIRNGQAKTVLVIGAETFSRILDWEDRRTCVLFGDGAGAVVLQAVEGQGTIKDQGILASRLHSDGSKYELLYVNGGPSSTQTVGYLQMEGKEVFRHAVTNLAGVIREVLADTGLEASDIDWLVPHQANRRILDSTAKKFGISEDKVVITVDRHANTSAASIPLALAEAVHDGRIQRGDIVILEAMGGGFTWGAALVRW
ncbi:beta-ketoacyl-ACP synthase III [Thalassospira xianhensis]|uniref:Beta-ketoacyl-[acyl-carrier-protein] synthase III n=1 Tax=Thalassospira xianhensis MCCC 1A02616 TaxID=1177929 RepID=A0A367UFE9_9PROT|nr:MULTISPECIES: beta-ketoacyl-ACP synthase III [Thalassospira]MAZ34571.1 3-oxoacyl-ACP synthase [Thalassospira sp.]MBO9508751.1 ketoacyl-ACP synthase III [Thalassospira sp. A3_1]RCK05782.1 3-oxoacyl-ACP synthase [Thalassospira xianhensis MCCC 1A02616]WOI10494.1 beta-ketoacyl-ACP synthase III [Thalassospira lucentensis]|tara:strand:- start:346 stop:1317 length:972 start_codon:yes stop_codon:yes gene_type:complete